MNAIAARTTPGDHLPTFVGLGAQRAGTTWLYDCLSAHPEVFMSRKKELYFFSRNYEQGLEWYLAQFAEAGIELARGEITPDYMYREHALQRLAADLPGIKTFVILRSPLDRAISAYALHPDRYRGMSFKEATVVEPSLLDRGFYARHLRTIYKYIPPERVKILFFDDIAAAPGKLLDELAVFIGVSAGFRPPALGKRVNRVIYPDLQRRLKALRLGWTVDLVKHSPLGNLIRHRHSKPRRDDTALSESDLHSMTALFADDVRELASMTGRNLDRWLE